MLLNSKDMIGVPVETRDGRFIGKVASFNVDAITGKLSSLLVHAPGIVSGLFRDELLVDWNVILEMTPDRVLVGYGGEASCTHGEKRSSCNHAESNYDARWQ